MVFESRSYRTASIASCSQPSHNQLLHTKLLTLPPEGSGQADKMNYCCFYVTNDIDIDGKHNKGVHYKILFDCF